MCLRDVKVPATVGCMVGGIMDQGAGLLHAGNKEEERLLDNANSEPCMYTDEHKWRLRSWLTTGGLVNIARVKVIDLTWAGTDEPDH